MTRTRDTGSFRRKAITWLAALLLVWWIARDPHQAAAVFHGLTTGFATLARNLHTGRTPKP